MSTIYTRKEQDCINFAVAQQLNALHDALAALGTLTDGYATHNFHRDVSGVPGGTYEFPTSTTLAVSAATAVDLPTVIALANNIRGVLLAHLSDDSAHQIRDTVNYNLLLATVVASDLTSVETLLNSMVTIYTAHRTQSGVHMNNDTFNVWLGGTAPPELKAARIGRDPLLTKLARRFRSASERIARALDAGQPD